VNIYDTIVRRGGKMAITENFDTQYKDFFKERDYNIRWRLLKDMYSKDPASFRVLFVVETLGLLDKWAEPTSAELEKILHHQMSGGKVAIRIGRILDLFQPVWPLEIAKYEYMIHRATWEKAFLKKYVFTGIRSYATALVQSWWAFETLMNDSASIILKERSATLDPISRAMLAEERATIDKTGSVSFEPYYQHLMPRFQFIYRVLTSEELKRDGSEWRALMELKNTRDAYVHRLGKESGAGTLENDQVIVEGFAAVRTVVEKVFTKTPEFAKKFVYKYLAFWSCGFECPFVWDAREGDGFYLGLGDVSREAITALFAPMPGSFSNDEAATLASPQTNSTTPATK
jgi:hypothetical protein